VELEQLLAEGVGMEEGVKSGRDLLAIRNRCRLTLVSLNDGHLEPPSVSLLKINNLKFFFFFFNLYDYIKGLLFLMTFLNHFSNFKTK